jgi:hypothetical protein
LRKRYILVIMLLASLLVAARQAGLTESFTTSGGVMVRFPPGYEATEDSSYGLTLSNTGAFDVMIVEAGPAVDEGLPAPLQSVEAVYEHYALVLETIDATLDRDARSSRIINDREAIRQPLMLDETLEAVLLVFEIRPGEFGVMLAVRLLGDPRTADLENLMVAVAQTVRLVSPPLATPELSPYDRPRTPAEMPPNTVRFVAGSQVSYPDGWSIFRLTDFIENSVTFNPDDDPRISAIITDYGADETTDLALLKRIHGGRLAAAAGDQAFDAETSFEPVTLADGRTAYRYIPRSGTDASAPYIVLYLVPLAENRFGSVQGQGLPGNLPPGFDDDLLAMAESFALLDEGGESATVNLYEVECDTPSDQLVNQTTTAAIAICPAGCNEGIVWGTDVYTSDSSVCTAAVHAGVITVEQGGPVYLEYRLGKEAYPSSERNGIITGNWGRWNASFVVESAW